MSKYQIVNPNTKVDLADKEEKDEKKSSKPNLDTEVGYTAECLMNAAKSLHKLHLKVKGQGSYAAHNALNGYDKFHDFADDLVENYQGAACVLIDIPSELDEKLNTVEEGINYLKELKEEITELQDKLPYSEIVNLLDTVKEHVNGMLYKLKFLS